MGLSNFLLFVMVVELGFLIYLIIELLRFPDLSKEDSNVKSATKRSVDSKKEVSAAIRNLPPEH